MKPTTENGEKQRDCTRIALIASAVTIVCLVATVIGISASGNLRGGESVKQDLPAPTIETNTTTGVDETPETADSVDSEEEIIPIEIPNGLKTMPNLGFLLSGYDLMFGNPLPTSASGVLTSDPGFRLPVFASEFSKVQTTQDNRYLVPNGMSVRSCAGTCSLSFTSSLIESAKHYSDQLSFKAKVSASSRGFFRAKFSASTDYQRVERGTSSEKELVTQSEASCCAYSGELPQFDLPNFHPTFLAGLATLTDDLDESVYRTFIDAFGTHYVQKGFMGAVYGEQSIISEDTRTSFESRNLDIRAAASASAFGITASASLQTSAERELSQQFRSQGVQRSVYSHGSPPPADGKPETWAQQTIDNPAPISIELERLDSLPLPVSEAVMANLGQALDTYCTRLVQDNIVGTCDAPSDATLEVSDCPVKANQFLITSCANWGLVAPVSCGDGCCYQNTCFAFDAGFRPVQDCLETAACTNRFN